jgi:hypothetical protein
MHYRRDVAIPEAWQGPSRVVRKLLHRMSTTSVGGPFFGQKKAHCIVVTMGGVKCYRKEDRSGGPGAQWYFSSASVRFSALLYPWPPVGPRGIHGC